MRIQVAGMGMSLKMGSAAAYKFLAIRDMQVSGAPLIGVTAAYGVALALQRMKDALLPLDLPLQKAAAWRQADALCEQGIACNRAIGEHGLGVLRALSGAGERTINIMTHCNAGAFASAGNDTALAPIYLAHVWVSETRPRNQRLLTARELGRAGSELGVAAQVPTHNPAFNITPARLVCGIICESGVIGMQSSLG